MMASRSDAAEYAMRALHAPGFVAAVSAAGCLSVTTLDGERLAMTSPEFSAYVESVFRAQNRIATELAFALETGEFDSAGSARLESAESELLVACAGLNEIAAERRDGRARGRLGQAEVARQAPECERATRDAEAALASIREQAAYGD